MTTASPGAPRIIRTPYDLHNTPPHALLTAYSSSAPLLVYPAHVLQQEEKRGQESPTFPLVELASGEDVLRALAALYTEKEEGITHA